MLNWPVLSDEALTILAETSPTDDSEPGWFAIKASSLPGRFSESEEALVKIPRYLDSKELVEFIGYTKKSASEIFDRYRDALPNFPELAKLCAFFRGRVYASANTSSDNDDEWSRVILNIGINPTVKDQILDPGFRELRLRQSAHYWVLDTTTTIYDWLHKLDSLVRTSHPKGSGLGTLDRKVRDDELNLLKGGSEISLAEAFCHQRIEPSKFEFRLGFTDMRPVGDFSPYTQGVYLSEHREIARHDAMYAQRRLTQGDSCCQAGILHVILKREFLHDAEEIYGDDWKEFVMYCRLRSTPPTHLKSYEQASVLIDPVLMANDHQLMGMVSRDRDFRSLRPYRLSDGWCATQYCFKDVFRSDLRKYVRMWWEPLESPLLQEGARVI
ncbi:MAG: hypothetical protein L6R41_003540 [Letrouitia leprolyta]|nr:MAG: hypothetical protein L6R41_003540 [Letrouitia leprolyta]